MKISRAEWETARASRMTGPRATPPSFKAILKTVMHLRRGGTVKGSWRKWPKIGKKDAEYA